MSKDAYYKETVDKFLGEIKTVCHAMIDGEHVADSPVKQVREALQYLDEKYDEIKRKEQTK